MRRAARAERRRLSRELQRSPRRALRRGDFLRRAAIAGLRTAGHGAPARGNDPGRQLDPDALSARRRAVPRASGEQPLDLAGSFPMVIDFDAGPG